MFSLSLICSQNIVGCGEMSSPNYVIDVVIDGGKQKKPRQVVGDTCRGWSWRFQIR
jgi:hypothetical protein